MVDSCIFLEDKNSNIFFKDSNVIKEMNGPSPIRNFILLLGDEMENESSKLKEI